MHYYITLWEQLSKSQKFLATFACAILILYASVEIGRTIYQVIR